jgi:hypothetical protein
VRGTIGAVAVNCNVPVAVMIGLLTTICSGSCMPAVLVVVCVASDVT